MNDMENRRIAKKLLNNFRRYMGLVELTTKDRPCLKCGRTFTSESNVNRICYPCAKLKNY